MEQVSFNEIQLNNKNMGLIGLLGMASNGLNELRYVVFRGKDEYTSQRTNVLKAKVAFCSSDSLFKSKIYLAPDVDMYLEKNEVSAYELTFDDVQEKNLVIVTFRTGTRPNSRGQGLATMLGYIAEDALYDVIQRQPKLFSGKRIISRRIDAGITTMYESQVEGQSLASHFANIFGYERGNNYGRGYPCYEKLIR